MQPKKEPVSPEKANNFVQIRDFVEGQINAAIESVAKGSQFQEIQRCCEPLIQQILKSLTKVNRNFRYIVNCTMVPAKNSNLTVMGCSFWDQETDGSVTVRKSVSKATVIVNVFCISG